MNGADRPQTGPQRVGSGMPGFLDSGGNGVQEGATGGAPSAPPTISLPKGGGAIRGIGEKFSANPVTGTGSLSVPIYTSPGRSGFGPQLSLSYDSGAGNGPFGFGWSLSLPSITRKTDKGLPKYQDAEESDVFVLSGAEDLVPVLVESDGQWQREALPPRTVGGEKYEIERYRPRIEGLFARIERWTNQADSTDAFWRSISKDSITTWYGKTSESRIADPDDRSRVFSWLICESYDDKGNAIVYGYREEDSGNIDFSQAHERNRSDDKRKANRYLKRIRYGNHTPYLPELSDTQPWPTPPGATAPNGSTDWYFEVVLDYGEHEADAPKPNDSGTWNLRKDPFSSYRAGFEVRTYRLCQRVLMFHHFPDEPKVGADCLVRSTDFTYSYEDNEPDPRDPIFSFLQAATQSGYKRQDDGSYLGKSLPPLEFEYTQPTVQEEFHEVDTESLENLPYGVDNGRYQWLDLDGEGLSGVLTEQAEGWFYKRNLSPINVLEEDKETVSARFAPVERVAEKPSVAALGDGRQQFLDLAGDGQIDLVTLEGPIPGFYERTDDGRWKSFAPFRSLPVLDWNDPNLKFVDLTGDGHADVLISEDEVFCWHPSLAEDGFGPPERVRKALDEEKGPRLVFADGTQSIHLADLSGDGMTDLVRIRNGEVCYWPNLGYGRFDARVTMDNAPLFDSQDLFDQRRVRLADIDGSGVTDIIYLGRDGVHLYFNESGNSWSEARHLNAFPAVDNLSSVQVADLLGNGTACLVWSSPLPGDGRRPMRYLDLMGGRKPHLMVKSVNNLGAETRVRYAPSTRFYLADKLAGKPWITKIPFPVLVVERVETYDHVSRNRFVTRYAYHHGYFDGAEREFRGFGMVEQFDTEEFAALSAGGDFPNTTNIDEASHVPPVHTKTWFHTGVYLGRDHISNFFAGLSDGHDRGEYYREPAWLDDDDEAKKRLLDDTVLPPGLTIEEEREACRALKGAMLRQEVYALDGTDKEQHPYTVTEQNFTIRRLQPQAGNRHAVFFTHAREAINYHYERNPADPRIAHALTLEVDAFGNVLKEAAIGYGRRQADRDLPLRTDRDQQTQTLITYTENRVTNIMEAANDYRTPLPCETRTYELTGYTPSGAAGRFQFSDFVEPDANDPDGLKLIHIFDSEIKHEDKATNGKQRRLIEHVRKLYRGNDLSGLLPLGRLESLALPGESYKLAFTPGLLAQVYKRKLGAAPEEILLPDAVQAQVLGGKGEDQGGYVDLDANGNWWIPSGRRFYSTTANVADPAATAAPELTEARQHFFSPRKFTDPFDHSSTADYDMHDLMVVKTEDAAQNKLTALHDYRVLQPKQMTDPNGNRSEVAFDALGMVVATAVMGKANQNLGDLPEAFEADPALDDLQGFIADPQGQAASLLGKATTRIVYDLDRHRRCAQPPFASTLARETHFFDPGGAQTEIQISFSYSDGFGREIQKKIRAEAGDAPQRQANVPLPTGDVRPGDLVRDANGKILQTHAPRRWVGTGRTVFNNKGKPVKQYEPFFSATHLYEAEREMTDTGVSPVLFYDPAERVVATLHPNHTYEKVVFDPWRQTTWDVNDTVTLDPAADEDVKGYFLHPDGTPRLPTKEYLPTWHALRTDLAFSAEATERWPDPGIRSAEKNAAEKAKAHEKTPATAHFDTLGRPFLMIAHNKFEREKPDGTIEIVEEKYPTRVELDIEGNQREVLDAKNRVVMRYDYDIAGLEEDEDTASNRIHQASMEAGERWTLNDVSGKPIRAWDSRGHAFRTEYDPLRRPLRSFVTGADPANPSQELLTERLVYGEQHPEGEVRNLRGALYLHLDQAGMVTNENHDFKGNPLRASRRLAQEYKRALNWSGVDAVLPTNATTKLDPVALKAALAPPLLETDTFTSRTTYDALNRPVQIIAPRSDQPGAKRNVIQPGYNEANLLERVIVWLDHSTEPTELLNPDTTPPSPVGVNNINYDAKGQRLHIEYKNGASTRYAYDLETFRLIHLYTRRGTSFTEDCENPQPPPPTIAAPEKPPEGKQCGLQNLHYTYDPAGNITHIRDDAQQTIYFDGQVVPPHCDYTYDAIYRLIKAAGREHIGQVEQPQTTWNDEFRVNLQHPGDGQAMRNYTEAYEYDEVGNFEKLIHQAANGGWTRSYAYNEASLIETAKKSNRLGSTTVGNSAPETYTYDAHGNMTKMPHLSLMQWDYRDQLQATSKQVVNNDGTPETTWYVYDVGGERVRKATERQAAAGQTPARMEERIYLGGFEIYREYENNGDTVKLERETLHIMDDQQRIALVETRTLDTAGDDPAPPQLIRYQLGNHLGSASLELDVQGQIISYEEYTPYGSTSYQAVQSGVEVSPKRYRYTGKERDEESGFYYHGARNFAPWVARWTSADPAGLVDGTNLYWYSRNNPLGFIDPEGTQPVLPEDRNTQFGRGPFGPSIPPPDSMPPLEDPRDPLIIDFGNGSRGAVWINPNPEPEPAQEASEEDGGSLVVTGVDVGTDFVPGVSNVKDATIALTGVNPVTGESVGVGGRIAAGVFAVPGVGNAAKYGVKGGKLIYKGGRRLFGWLGRKIFGNAAKKKAAREAAEKTAKEAEEKAAKEAEVKAREAAETAAKEAAERATEASVVDKLQRYLLDPSHPVGGSKAKWFKEALGFTQKDASELAKQIKFDPAKAVATGLTQHGQKFEQVISIVGTNRKTIDVPFVWIRNNDGVVRLVTAIPPKRPPKR